MTWLHEWKRYLLAPRKHGHSWPAVIWCRWRGHPSGVWWYSSGNEPDMHCKGCGDDLG